MLGFLILLLLKVEEVQNDNISPKCKEAMDLYSTSEEFWALKS